MLLHADGLALWELRTDQCGVLQPSCLCDLARVDVALGLSLRFSLGDFELIGGLEIHPKLRCADKIAAESQRRVGADALAQLTWAAEIDPNFPLTHLCLGMTYVETGEYASAIEAFQRGAEMGRGSLFETGLAIKDTPAPEERRTR